MQISNKQKAKSGAACFVYRPHFVMTGCGRRAERTWLINKNHSQTYLTHIVPNKKELKQFPPRFARLQKATVFDIETNVQKHLQL